MKATVVNYGMGNVGSIVNMLRKMGHESIVASSPEEILKAEILIIPGVGSFDLGIQRLRENKLEDALNEKVLNKKFPVLGICLGMQLMAQSSEEGNEKGLGWIDAHSIRFDPSLTTEIIRVPHMGWNTVSNSTKPFLNSAIEQKFYFMHAYHLTGVPSSQILFTTHYGYDFVSGVIHENICGVQFHPEKSHHFGMEFLKNYLQNI